MKVDPDVLEPGYEIIPGVEIWATGGSEDTFLYDWCIANEWDPDPPSPPTQFVAGYKDETAGVINCTTEGIKLWTQLGKGVGANGTGKLATFYFTSLSQTEYSPIEIFEAYYYTSWQSPNLDKHVPDVIINGHYNEPPEHDVAITDIGSSSYTIDITDPSQLNVTISVDIANEGDFTETFNVTVRYDTTDIDTQTVANLTAGNSTTKDFDWDVTGVGLGTYTIEAEAILAGDANPTDNIKTSDLGIEIVPEFPTEISLLLVFVILAVSTIVLKRRHL